MYKRLVICAAALAIFVSPFAYADSTAANLTNSQVNMIQANCLSVQSTLSRIHANDALSRVHLGQEYETISTKLMAPMNSRVAIAKLDSVAMVQTTVKFNDGIDKFRDLYQTYEQTMSSALQMKCTKQPNDFYNALVKAQDQRAAVRDSVKDLASLVTQYQKEVATVRAQALAVDQQVRENQ